MKKNLLPFSAFTPIPWTAVACHFALGAFFFFGACLTTSAQWVAYEANELPNAFTTSPFVVASANPAASTGLAEILANENTIIADPDKTDNKLLQFSVAGAPNHVQFLWRQNLPTSPANPTALTVVVRAKGLSGFDRLFELDLDFAGFRETVYILANGTFSFNYAKSNAAVPANAALASAPLNTDPMQWHTYRFTKVGATTTLYIDENTTPLATGVTAEAQNRNYFRIGDGSSVPTNGSLIDYIIWDASGAYSPAQKPLPTDLLLSSQGERTTINSLKMYPNPSNGNVLVMYPAAKKGARLEVYSLSGVKVASFGIDQNANNTSLALDGLSKGIYSLVYIDGVERITSRLVKQ